ncbi:MAG: HD domain-containing protein, partial [Eggerthellaceae bacterium]|nr:HD domain-containing protein [Eggerthellaceae bacterium]
MDGDSFDKLVALHYGALLHDIGKIVYRGGSEQESHSVLGARFMQQIGFANNAFSGAIGNSIIEQIRYHHREEMPGSVDVEDDSLDYITSFANAISDEVGASNEGLKGCLSSERGANLRKIFNILNGHDDANTVEHDSYTVVLEHLKTRLASMAVSHEDIDTLLCALEELCASIPSSTDAEHLIDVSLFDHAKTTAAISACIFRYLEETGEPNYRKVLFGDGDSAAARKEDMFLLCAYDLSGIQSFIYNISGNGALKQLRARSWYLEMLLEHIADVVLSR